eukprot:138503-Pelagomonas_calceolata.AAC.5
MLAEKLHAEAAALQVRLTNGGVHMQGERRLTNGLVHRRDERRAVSDLEWNFGGYKVGLSRCG